MLAIEHSADDAVPQHHTQQIFDAAASTDKTMLCIKGATHYFSGQPELLAIAADSCVNWIKDRRLLS
jgi:esterase/lipase